MLCLSTEPHCPDATSELFPPPSHWDLIVDERPAYRPFGRLILAKPRIHAHLCTVKVTEQYFLYALTKRFSRINRHVNASEPRVHESLRWLFQELHDVVFATFFWCQRSVQRQTTGELFFVSVSRWRNIALAIRTSVIWLCSLWMSSLSANLCKLRQQGCREGVRIRHPRRRFR